MSKIIVLIYGFVSYFIGVAGFAAILLALIGWIPFGFFLNNQELPGNPIVWNFILVALWGFFHSLMARPAFKTVVWSILTDGKRYSEWNPFIIHMQGSIEKGSQLKNTMEPLPGEQRIFKPTILEAKPNQELRWIGRVGIPGVFDGEHYFLLETEAGGTRFIHGEKFSGFALWFMDTDKFAENFEAMNAALSERVIFNSKIR